MKYVCGLDLSLTSTGFVVVQEDAHILFSKPLTTKTGPHVLDRCSSQIEEVIHWLTKSPEEITFVIENYAFGSQNIVPSVTVGTVWRYFLRQNGHEYIEVAPQQLKKFVGAKKKEDVKLAAFKRWGFEHRSNDVVDAYVLARIGLCLKDYCAMANQQQAEVVAKILSAD